MHRTKKIVVTATAAALLSAAGMSSAMASRTDDHGNDKVTICHRTGSDKNPYVMITISENAVQAHKRHPAIHGRSDIFPTPGNPITSCPTGDDGNPPPPPVDDDDEGCIASSGSGDSTQSQHGLINVGNINLGLNNALGNLFCQSNVGNGLAIAGIGHALGGYVGDDDSGDGSCVSDDFSGDSDQEQEGLVNVGNLNLGLNNVLGNAFCQSNVLNGLAVAGIGHALAGDLGGDDSGAGDCIASSGSGDSEQEQEGLVNVGNLNVGGNNLLANAFCGANVLNGVAVAGIGEAVGGYVGDDDSGDGGCIADSTSGDSDQDQFLSVNVGNINAGANDLLANAFCQADVLNGAAVSVIGPAVGGSGLLGSGLLGTGILSGSPLDILGYSTSGLVSGLTADVSVVAGILLYL
jgi:hypothetical protein